MKQLSTDLSKKGFWGKLSFSGLCLLAFSLAAEQTNVSRSNVAHSSNAFIVEDGIDAYRGLGNEYKYLFFADYNFIEAPYIIIDELKDQRRFKVVDTFTRIRFGGGVHFTPNFYLGLSVPVDMVSPKPYVPGTDNLNMETDPFLPEKTLLGDIEAVVKYRIPNWSHIWNWTLVLRGSLPTGDELYFNTDHSYALQAGFAFSRYFSADLRWRFYGNFGYRYAPESRVKISSQFSDLDTRGRFNLGAGLSYRFLKKTKLFTELNGFVAVPFDTDQNPVEITAGLSHSFSILQAYAGVGLESLNGELYSNDTRYFAGLKTVFGRRHKPINKKEVYESFSKPQLNFQESEKTEESFVKTPPAKPSLQHLILRVQSIARTIQFQTGKALLLAPSRLKLVDAAQEILRTQDKLKLIRIEGHTDSRGTEESNMSLSQQRAEAVKNFLVENGVEESKLLAKGFGESKPIAEEVDTYSRELNRRVDIKIESLNGESF